MTSDALECFDTIAARLDQRPPVLFADFDGTLTPIAETPSGAELDAAMRQRLQLLAARMPVAVITGRDLENVRERVGIEGVFYAGSHGFDIDGPGARLEQPEARAYLPVLDHAERTLRAELGAVPGVILERKRYSLAVHYRQLAPDNKPFVEQAVSGVARREGLRRTDGKKVHELQPPVPWDKGCALRWILRARGLAVDRVTPLYLGDDLTDEDAFRALPAHGIGILVGAPGVPTAAGFRLSGPEAVGGFLDRLLESGGS